MIWTPGGWLPLPADMSRIIGFACCGANAKQPWLAHVANNNDSATFGLDSVKLSTSTHTKNYFPLCLTQLFLQFVEIMTMAILEPLFAHLANAKKKLPQMQAMAMVKPLFTYLVHAHFQFVTCAVVGPNQIIEPSSMVLMSLAPVNSLMAIAGAMPFAYHVT